MVNRNHIGRLVMVVVYCWSLLYVSGRLFELVEWFSDPTYLNCKDHSLSM
jgi:hypothetical protein